MAYPTKFLTENERVVREFHPHWVALVGPILITVLAIAASVALWSVAPMSGWDPLVNWILTGLVVLVWIVFAVAPVVRWRFTQYVVTNERIIVRAGVLARRGTEIPLDAINDVKFAQTFLERILHSGDVVLESAGEHGQSKYSNIPNPEAFQSQVYRLREERTVALGSETSRDPATQLETLARLHRDGVISDAEFSEKRQALLDQI